MFKACINVIYVIIKIFYNLANIVNINNDLSHGIFSEISKRKKIITRLIQKKQKNANIILMTLTGNKNLGQFLVHLNVIMTN